VSAPRGALLYRPFNGWGLDVSIHGAVNWSQLMTGSGGSQGFPSMAARMASSAVMPWAAAVSRAWNAELRANASAKAGQGDLMALASFGPTAQNPSQGAVGSANYYAFRHWHPGVQPQRHRRVPQVIRASAERRPALGRGEGLLAVLGRHLAVGRVLEDAAARRRASYGSWLSQEAGAGFAGSAARRYSALMRWASSSWSSRMTMRQAASTGVPWSTSSRARAAMRSW
jgi:hypothetical protein